MSCKLEQELKDSRRALVREKLRNYTLRHNSWFNMRSEYWYYEDEVINFVLEECA